ncbi:MAG TPA: response regulator transcription factor [bacterium]|nr:response regulator transcription factor [bacterium]HPR89059.1 response regulator transcription factor [bacterium]
MAVNEGYPGSMILLVEDEESLAVGLEFNLREEGFVVVRAQDGRQALAEFSKLAFDLVILDIMLPYIDGFEVARRMRQTAPQLPILMLTARKTAQDRIEGLKTGADDYLTKPFHIEELILRVKGMLRRKEWYREEPEVAPLYHFGSNEVNFATLRGRRGASMVQITPREAMVLHYLIAHRDRVVTRKELLEKVWQMHGGMETRTIDNFIMRLRKHFEEDPAHPRYIISIRGAGYMFKTS